jgi:hypothetical protein
MTEYGQPGIICAWPFPRPYTWQNSRSGLVAAPGRSQLQTSAASRIRPSGQAGSGSPASARRSPPDHDPAVVHRVIQRAMTPPVLRHQRQPGQRPHRPVRTQRRTGQLEQLIAAGGQAPAKVQPKPRQHGQGLDTSGMLKQAVHHGLRGDHLSFGENT